MEIMVYRRFVAKKSGVQHIQGKINWRLKIKRKRRQGASRKILTFSFKVLA
uniref:TNP2 n=1 Tax=Solanum tuberosum TaxID=4113 RepID=M1CTG5_SOLTU